MRVVHLNSFDSKGGAAKAAHRLHEGCREIGHDSKMLVMLKESNDPNVEGLFSGRTGWLISKGYDLLDSSPMYWYRRRTGVPFSPGWVSACGSADVRRQEADVVHLHWITHGFISPELIGDLESSLVWTFHDMWPITGGCHYSGDCRRYEQSCGSCPVLGSDRSEDLSRRVWERKRSALESKRVQVVVPSDWLAARVKESPLFDNNRVKVIPNPLDIDHFAPPVDGVTPADFGLPRDKRVVLFGGIAAIKDPRKGFDLLSETIGHLAKTGTTDEIALVVFGSQLPKDIDLDIETHELGYVIDGRLPAMYAMADIAVVPSRQESFGQTASEAMACGTPVAAFRTTGLRDIVDHQRTGYLAEAFDPADLAEGIDWLLEDNERLMELSIRAREKAAERYDHRSVAEAYSNLYRTAKNL